MSEEFDLNKTVAAFLHKQVEHWVDELKHFVQHSQAQITSKISSSFRDYLHALGVRSSYSKSFFHRLEAVYLYSFYVPSELVTTREKTIKSRTSVIFANSNKIVITGLGGSGKSLMLKHLVLELLAESEKLPVVVELRDLNNSNQALDQVIFESLTRNGWQYDKLITDKLIKKGLFVFLLDGFDELDSNLRASTAHAIRNLSGLDSKNQIIVTSRPDIEFNGWHEFSIFSMAPLSLAHAVELVEKCPLDEEFRQKFTADLQDTLFRKHISFLSNPLLLSIMVLTYQDAADIPSKLSLFYALAFEALFQRHDSMKGAFKRPRKTQLDIQDFGKMMEALSILTYDQRTLSFTQSEGLELISNAKKITNTTCDSSDFLKDCIQATCLLMEDGTKISYVHRSFQEYFAALFIIHTDKDTRLTLLKRYSGRLGADNTISLAYEIHPTTIEKDFILPRIRKLLHSAGVEQGAEVTDDAFIKFSSLLWKEFSIGPDAEGLTNGDPDVDISDIDIMATVKNADLNDFVDFCIKIFPEVSEIKSDHQITHDVFKHLLEEFYQTHLEPDPDSLLVDVPISTLSSNQSLFNAIKNGSNYFGIKTLMKLVRIEDVIRKKQSSAEKSLAEILGLNIPNDSKPKHFRQPF